MCKIAISRYSHPLIKMSLKCNFRPPHVNTIINFFLCRQNLFFKKPQSFLQNVFSNFSSLQPFFNILFFKFFHSLTRNESLFEPSVLTIYNNLLLFLLSKKANGDAQKTCNSHLVVYFWSVRVYHLPSPMREFRHCLNLHIK